MCRGIDIDASGAFGIPLTVLRSAQRRTMYDDIRFLPFERGCNG